MLEAYLFVDPLCRGCIRSERIIQKIAREVRETFSYHFIPILNVKIMNNYPSLKKQRPLYYQIVLDYKAASFQGRRRGRSFFMMLQDEIINRHYQYNNKMVMATAENAQLDLDMFREDRRSPLAQKTFWADQKLAYRMDIHKPSSVVIYNCNVYRDGILINQIDYMTLLKICCTSHHNIHNSNQIYDHNGIPIPKLWIN